jgi:phosphopantothenate---cysteine ligase (CTP)
MNVVVTSGGTVAPIDDVRQVTNTSTGRFGSMIAEEALRRGANVWYLSPPAALKPFHRLAKFDLDSPDPAAEVRRLAHLRLDWADVRDRCSLVPLREPTVEVYARTLESVLKANPIDVVFLAMAASDYAPEPTPGKLSSEGETLTLRCRRLPKVIRSVRDWSPEVYLVGFKLLSDAPEADLIRQAREACEANRADLTVANDLATVRAGRHTIHLVRPGHPTETFGPEGPIAERLVDRAFAWAGERPRPRPRPADLPPLSPRERG